MLLRALYAETLEHLTGGGQADGRTEREAAAKEALAARAAGLVGRARSRPRRRGTTRPTGSASTPAPTRSSPS